MKQKCNRKFNGYNSRIFYNVEKKSHYLWVYLQPYIHNFTTLSKNTSSGFIKKIKSKQCHKEFKEQAHEILYDEKEVFFFTKFHGSEWNLLIWLRNWKTGKRQALIVFPPKSLHHEEASPFTLSQKATMQFWFLVAKSAADCKYTEAARLTNSFLIAMFESRTFPSYIDHLVGVSYIMSFKLVYPKLSLLMSNEVFLGILNELRELICSSSSISGPMFF